MQDIERRTVGCELRGIAGRMIQGHAALYGSLSEDLGGFREQIQVGAFDRALREGHDVRALWNHNSDMVLGRTKSGTLRLSTDSRGLRIEADMPDTSAGRDALVSIARGDVDQMSFGFRTLDDDWRTVGGETVRDLIDLELLDVSPCAYPAYQETQVSARALDRARGSRGLEGKSVLRLRLELIEKQLEHERHDRRHRIAREIEAERSILSLAARGQRIAAQIARDRVHFARSA